MRHLVLGSSGQIGSYVCDELTRQGHHVVHWDIADGRRYDLCRDAVQENLHEVMLQCDFVHFLAYNVGGSQYLMEYESTFDYVDENVRMMEKVFYALRRIRKPFYFASSQMQNMSDSIYGRLKSIGEDYTRALGGVNVRFWNVYGYEPISVKNHVITDFLRAADGRRFIYCKTDGTEYRNFLHAADCAEKLVMITDNYDHFAQSSYVAVHNHGASNTIKEVAETIAKVVAPPEVLVRYTNKQDTTQTIFNDPMQHITHPELEEVGNRFANLEDGIRDVYQQIKTRG